MTRDVPWITEDPGSSSRWELGGQFSVSLIRYNLAFVVSMASLLSFLLLN